jgi:hypothetical protein
VRSAAMSRMALSVCGWVFLEQVYKILSEPAKRIMSFPPLKSDTGSAGQAMDDVMHE